MVTDVQDMTVASRWWTVVLTHLATVGVVLAGVLAGLVALEGVRDRLFERPVFTQPPLIRVTGLPPGVETAVLSDLPDLTGVPWTEPRLCQAVWWQLSQNGWIRTVRRVFTRSCGTVVADCVYRTPRALVRYGEYFYMVDEYGIRLPGRYDYLPQWLLIEGVQSAPPAPGLPWTGADLQAAINLAAALRDTSFYAQVAALSVKNYRGRQEPQANEIELITAPDASRILWGSAPGEEFEENTVHQKLHILSENYRRYGRIDAGHATIDISVHPDSIQIPA